MRKLSKINEDIFDNIFKNDSEKNVRKEDGVKVKTILDNYIILENPNSKYNVLINDLIDINSTHAFLSQDFGMHINKLSELKLSNKEISKDPYTYLIYEGKYGTSLVVSFETYKDIINFELDNDFEDSFTENDYISICKGVSEKLKEIGDCIDYVPEHCDSLYSDEWNDNNYTNKYRREYLLKLIDESTVYEWNCYQEDDEKDNADYIEEFVDDITDNFSELKDNNEDFVIWSYREGFNVAIPITASNIKNIRKYIEYTKNWFKV